MEEEYIEKNPIKYLKDNYDLENIINHPKIKIMLEKEHEYQFLRNMRKIIEDLNQKYIDLYSYSGIFEKDKFNNTWERAYDIIYSNLIKQYDINLIYENAEEVIKILEK